MHKIKYSPTKLLVALLIVGFTHAVVAKAENWQAVGSDKDGSGNDMRTIEIDMDSIKSSGGEVSVKAKITNSSRGKVGYNCSEGEIRHGKVPKSIAKMICDKPSSPNPYGGHVANWKTVRLDRVKNGELKTQIDLESISRNGDSVMTTQMLTETSRLPIHFDCKGYYKLYTTWINLDLTDHTAYSPSGFVSLERKIATEVCS